ncbi:MAG: adenylyltransferase/cytidyltransferase family protein [Candidatus Micrarchaeia archaeon]
MPKGKVLVAGTFDFLHPGHIDFFCQAKKHGNKLVVIVSRDSNAKMIKGKLPYFSQKERLALVKALGIVDNAVLGDADDFFAAIRKEKPDAIVLGYDQWPKEEKIKAALHRAGLCKTKVLRAKANYPEKYKSSKIRKYFESI